MDLQVFGDSDDRVGVRQLAPNLYWICHCIGEASAVQNGDYAADFARQNSTLDPNATDVIYSAYLILDEKTFLIDNLSPSQNETVLPALNSVLGDRPLDYMWISHIELPHAGNTAQIQRAYPEVQLMTMGSNDHYEAHGLEDALYLDIGDTLNLGEHTIEIVQPLFVDHALTQWLFEHRTGFFCPVDWTHNLHPPEHCFHFMDDREADGYPVEQFTQEVSTIARYIFPWLRWADPQQAGAAVDDLFGRYDIKLIGGSHCNPIRTDIPKYAEALRKAMILAAEGEFEIVY